MAATSAEEVGGALAAIPENAAPEGDEAEEGELAQQKVATKPEIAVLKRMGYFNELVHSFETMRERRDTLDVWLRDAFAKRMELQQRLVAAKSREVSLLKAMPGSRREKLRIDRLLKALEAGGAGAQLALRELRDAEVPIEARASQLRNSFGIAPAAAARAPSSPLPPLRGAPALPTPAGAADDDGSPMTAAGTVAASPTSGPEDEAAEKSEMSVQVQSVSFTTEDSATLRARRYLPPESSNLGSCPVLVYFHGGGYVAGDLDSHDWACRCLAARARVAVLSVGYRRAPEARFPTAFEDAYAAVCWVAAGGLGAKPPALGVAGDVSGAGLALACGLRARDERGGPCISVQLLIAPWADMRPNSPSFQAADDAGVPFLADLSWSRGAYAPPHGEPLAQDASESSQAGTTGRSSSKHAEHPLGADGQPWFQDVRASPLLAESLVGLPATFVVLPASGAPLASDGNQLVKRLKAEAGKDAVKRCRLEADMSPDFAASRAAPPGASASAARAVLHSAADFAAARLRA